MQRGQDEARLPGGLSIEFVQYVPSLQAHMEAADLIISHAGSGSLFEALSLGKAIIAVPNAILMANHQVTNDSEAGPYLVASRFLTCPVLDPVCKPAQCEA